MKSLFKIFLILSFLNFINPVFAIDWVELTSPKGKTVYLDKDSIKEYNGSYFYNIKFKNSHHDDFIILTMQSGVVHQFSARLKVYKPSEYDALDGDYQNITKNFTKNLEMITYDSIVNTCYKEVKRIMEKPQIPVIEIN